MFAVLRDKWVLAMTPRALHPIVWWIWALALAVAINRTTNLLLLCLALGVMGCVVANRRIEAPWARAFKYYLGLGLVVIFSRVVFRIIFTTVVQPGDQVLFRLPSLTWAKVSLGGPVTLQSLVFGLSDGLRLATMLCCIGAANVLANPKRALRVLPGVLHEFGVALVVAVSFAPQLVESLARVRRAQRLRPAQGGRMHMVRRLLIPVLEDALERSLRLAASMDSRGFGRGRDAASGVRRNSRLTGAVSLAGLVLVVAGVYEYLHDGLNQVLEMVTIAIGCLLMVCTLALDSRRVRITRYRPDRWSLPEWIVTASGLACFFTLFFYGNDLNPVTVGWPTLPAGAAGAILFAVLPAFATPRPPRTDSTVSVATPIQIPERSAA